MKSMSGWLTAAAAVLVVAGTTYLHGRMTDRWGGKNVSAQLLRAATLLETRFPETFGEWAFDEELQSDARQLEKAGAVGHIWKSYKRDGSGAKVSVFIVCATPHDASGHTPDRCFPGAGFEIGETEHRVTVPLSKTEGAEAFSGTFRKAGQTIRVFWTYCVDGRWVAPQIARIELADAAAVYKLYAIIDETSLPHGTGERICMEFLGELVPELNRAFADEKPAAAAL